jgi:predicted Zn finger-like uncharacterized protein
MLIVCPTCATTYEIAPAALGAAGRNVRCSSCKNTWFATPDSMVDDAETAAVMAEASAPPPAPPRKAARDEVAPKPKPDEIPVPEPMPAEEPAVQVQEDAETVAVTDAPPLAPEDTATADGRVEEVDAGPSEDDIETIAARRARQRKVDRREKRTPRQMLFSLPTLIVTLLLVLGAALQFRVQMVKHFPQSAALYKAIRMPVNLRGLTFENVRTKSETADGVTVLVIEGLIVNPTRATLEVPRLRFVLRNPAGVEIYAWTALPSKTVLSAGDDLTFRTRLASPPPDGRDVIVRFFNRRDMIAGMP